jgi:hypothetical protein
MCSQSGKPLFQEELGNSCMRKLIIPSFFIPGLHREVTPPLEFDQEDREHSHADYIERIGAL